MSKRKRSRKARAALKKPIAASEPTSDAKPAANDEVDDAFSKPSPTETEQTGGAQ